MKHPLKGLSLTILLFVASLCASNAGSENPYDATASTVPITAPRHIALASWYGPRFFGHVMKCGKRYDENAVFTAHKTYPIGTKLVVTNLQNHRSIVVAVEDRGPYVAGRDLDLSYEAAKELDMIQAGVVLVSYREVATPS